MKSIKPGRGPSAMNGIGSIFAAIFGIIWTMVTVSMGAPWFFALFGIVFIGMAVFQAVYHWKNATSEDRFSVYDIVDSSEEGDAADRLIQREDRGGTIPEKDDVNFCPYCGTPVKPGYAFCAKCGRQLP